MRSRRSGALRRAQSASYQASGGRPFAASACSTRPTTDACAFRTARHASRCASAMAGAGMGSGYRTRSLRGNDIRATLEVVSTETTLITRANEEHEPMSELDGKVVIITGGGGGIGRAAASRFLEEGASVLL